MTDTGLNRKFEELRALWIVGDAFAEFRRGNEEVRLVSEFLEGAARGAFDGTLVLLGQGLSDQDEAAIFPLLSGENRRYLEKRRATPRASGALTHKHDTKNVLISEPWRESENFFLADLRVDGRCAEMSDHVTGSHLQGMLLVEAARQMLVSVTEQFLLPREEKRYSFVFNGFLVRFLEFGFPIGTRLRLELVNCSRRGDLAFLFEVKINVLQGERSLFQMESSFSVIQRDYIQRKELQLAQRSTKAQLTSAMNEFASAGA